MGVSAALLLALAGQNATLAADPMEPMKELAPPPPASAPATPTPAADHAVADSEAALRGSVGNAEKFRQALDDLLIAPPETISTALKHLLAPGDDNAAVSSAVLAGLAKRSWIPPAALPPLTEAMARVASDRRGPYYAAISSIRTPEAAKVLLTEAQNRAGASSSNGNGGNTAAPAASADEAIKALVRLTGRSDLSANGAANLDAWQRWFESASASDQAWSDALLRGLASAADNEAKNSDRSQQRLLDFLRQSYLDLETPEQRTAMLERLLKDDLAAVRKLGLQTVMQELANGRSPDQSLTERIVTRLSDPSQDVRTLAAELLNRLPVQTEYVGTIVNRVLAAEKDPAVAARLLPAAARWPRRDDLPVVLNWLSAGPPAREPAAVAVAAYLEAGLLADLADQAAVTQTLRSAELSSLGSAGLRLLVTLGTDADRDSVRRLLLSPTPAARLRAAEALLGDAGSVGSLISAAERDPALFSFAAQAVRNAGPTRQTYLALRGLPLPSGGDSNQAQQRRRESLVVLASQLTPHDLLAVARQEHDPEFREALLSRVTLAGLSPVPGPFGVMPDPDLKPAADSLLLLAETRLQLRQPAAAMSALAALGPVSAAVDQHRLARARCRVFVALDRLDDARVLDASADDWLDAFEENLALPHADGVADAIALRFPSLTEAQAARLNELRGRLSAGSPAPAPASPPPGNRTVPVGGSAASPQGRMLGLTPVAGDPLISPANLFNIGIDNKARP